MIFWASSLKSHSGRVKLKSKPGDDICAGSEPRLLEGVASVDLVEAFAIGAVRGAFIEVGSLTVLWCTLLGCISSSPAYTR